MFIPGDVVVVLSLANKIGTRNFVVTTNFFHVSQDISSAQYLIGEFWENVFTILECFLYY